MPLLQTDVFCATHLYDLDFSLFPLNIQGWRTTAQNQLAGVSLSSVTGMFDHLPISPPHVGDLGMLLPLRNFPDHIALSSLLK